jgi:hypothetical protein
VLAVYVWMAVAFVGGAADSAVPRDAVTFYFLIYASCYLTGLGFALDKITKSRESCSMSANI